LASDEGAQAIFVHVTSMLDLGTDWDAGADVPPERVPSPEDDPVLSEALELAALHRVPSRAELLIGYPPRQIARLANDVERGCDRRWLARFGCCFPEWELLVADEPTGSDCQRREDPRAGLGRSVAG
jgi:hypothetical protein